MERYLRGGLIYGNAFEMMQDDRCHLGRQAVAFRRPSESVSSLTLRTPISLRAARVSPKRWSFHSRPPLVSFFAVLLSFSIWQASSRGGLLLHSWNLPASNTWKSPFRERDDSLLCVSPTVVARRASVTPGRSQSRLDCEDYLLRLFRGFGREKASARSFCFFFFLLSVLRSSFSLFSFFFFFERWSTAGKVWKISFRSVHLAQSRRKQIVFFIITRTE